MAEQEASVVTNIPNILLLENDLKQEKKSYMNIVEDYNSIVEEESKVEVSIESKEQISTKFHHAQDINSKRLDEIVSEVNEMYTFLEYFAERDEVLVEHMISTFPQYF